MTSPSTEQAIKLAVDEMLEGIQIIDSDWRYVYVNSAAAEHGRSSKTTLIGNRMMECYPGIEATPVFQVLESVMKNREARRVENEFVYPNGAKCWFELFVEPYSGGILIRSIDITDRKKLEEQLHHAQKMEAIGRLAGGVAHDFNNKLGIIVAYCELAQEHLDSESAKIASYFEKILTAARQSSVLTKQLLAFSRKQVFDLKTVSLNDLISDLRASLEKMVGASITLNCHLQEKLGCVNVDPAQFEQVLLNLCLNARDAMPNGGTLTIETKETILNEEYARAHPDVLPGPFIMMAVSDTGHGMDKATLAHAFEPFFTTKQRGRGTGLGLSSVHGIVRQSRGHIWVYSEIGLGTVFKIYLPLAKAIRTEMTESQEGSVRVSGEGETLLVAEDDLSLREAYQAALESAGYTVIAVGSAEEAQQAFASNSDQISLLLTDLVLPKVNGRELAARLSRAKPDLKVIYMSGYTENSIVHQGVLDTESVLLQKPISIRQMLTAVRGVLDGKLKKALL